MIEEGGSIISVGLYSDADDLAPEDGMAYVSYHFCPMAGNHGFTGKARNVLMYNVDNQYIYYKIDEKIFKLWYCCFGSSDVDSVIMREG